MEAAVPSTSDTADTRPARLRWVGFSLLALLPVAIALIQLGRIHPDEVYQFLEPAYARTRGYGVLAWEWQVGLRNWAVPMLLSALLRVSDALGIVDPRGYRAVLALPQLLLHAFALGATFRYARRRVGEGAAWLATLAVALAAPVLVYAGRTLGESYSGDALLIALEQLDRDEPRASFFGGVWLGLSVVVRYGSGVFVVAALGVLAHRRRFRALALCVAGGALVAVLLGALDWATWGAPFHSLVEYLRFNVLTHDAARRFGTEPWFFYALPLLTALPLWAWAGAALGWPRERLPLPVVCGLVYLAAVSLTPHKEERFLYPAVVLLALGAAPWIAGWALACRQTVRPVAAGLVLVASLAPFAFGPDRVGEHPSKLARPELRGDQFRAIVKSTRGDAHGLLIVNEGIWGAGGFFYLGKRIPWLTCDFPRDPPFRHAMIDRRFDRAVTFEGRALDELKQAGFRVVGQVGRETMLERP